MARTYVVKLGNWNFYAGDYSAVTTATLLTEMNMVHIGANVFDKNTWSWL